MSSMHVSSDEVKNIYFVVVALEHGLVYMPFAWSFILLVACPG